MTFTGILHVHSTHSYDGKLSLGALRSECLKRGLSFACMTEHTDTLTAETAHTFIRECETYSDDTFLFIPGFEVPYGDAHVLHIGATQFIPAFADQISLKKWREVSPFVVLAHPVRNHFKVDDVLLEAIDGIEVWNQQYDGKLVPRSRSITFFDRLSMQKELLITGGLDFHRIEHFGSPIVTITAEKLSAASVVGALLGGTYTFGTKTRSFAGTDRVVLSSAEKYLSYFSTSSITLGKWVNRTLASWGIRLPKKISQVVRARL